ncbi:hypothetical protein V5O48_009629 [Marasmius crinis-equi]|uniref:MFS general substrate transporter n=1 Tax=Marasmius crinis-equi TaxID=585013 RepID=A0ABR3FAN3_9AGAR
MSDEVKSNSSLSEGKNEKDFDVGGDLKHFDSGYEKVDEQKTLRYIDFRIIPILAVIYAFSIIDQVNLATARVAGMGTDLNLNVGSRYSIVSCIYFVPLILLYKRHEVQKRIAGFYLTSALIGGFSSVLSYALSQLDGRQGIAGWSWIFIIEGTITVGLGILGFLIIPDFPDRNNFLSEAQTAFVLRRIEEDRGDSVPDEVTAQKVLHHLSDWTLWVYGIMFACATIPGYMLAFFLPIILGGLDFNTTQSLLLTCPPFAASCFTAMFFAWISDRSKHRSGFIVMQCLVTITGGCMTAFADSIAVRYTGLNLLHVLWLPRVHSWNIGGANNVSSQSKRSVQSALTIAVGGLGGVIASTVFREQDSPKYVPGLWVTIGLQIVCILLTLLLSLHFYRKNRLAEQGRLSEPLEGKPGFRFTL